MHWIKENRISVIATVLLLLVVFYLVINKKERWQGVYYPDGCLICEDEYIFSPVLNSISECISWGERKKGYRKNSKDAYECGKNCRWENGFNVCEETIGGEDTGVHF